MAPANRNKATPAKGKPRKAKPAAKATLVAKPKPTKKPTSVAKPKPTKKLTWKVAKPPTPKTIALVTSSARMSLGVGDEGIETREDGNGGCEVSRAGTPFASMTLDGDRMWIAVRIPRGRALEPEVDWQPDRAGWVKVSLPLARDPRPWLQSGVGGLIMEADWELRGMPRTITSKGGGPYIAIPGPLVGIWNPRALKSAAVDAAVSTLAHPHGDHLILGGHAGPLTWHPDATGGVLARVTRGAMAEAEIARLLPIPDATWAPAGTYRVGTTRGSRRCRVRPRSSARTR